MNPPEEPRRRDKTHSVCRPAPHQELTRLLIHAMKVCSMPSDLPPSLDARLSALIRRELGAGDVRILPLDESPASAPNVLVSRLGDGRCVVATFTRSGCTPALEAGCQATTGT